MNVHRISLDLNKLGGAGGVLRVSATDRRGTVVEVSVTDGGAPVDLTGLDATLVGRLAAGGTLSVPCSVAGSVAAATLDEADLSGLPADPAYVALTDGERAWSTARIRIETTEGVPR